MNSKVILIVAYKGSTLFRTEPLEEARAKEAVAQLDRVLGRDNGRHPNKSKDAYDFDVYMVVVVESQQEHVIG
jgi:hypothetical protein